VIRTSDVLTIHKKLIEDFGGSNGVRDTNALDSALKRPYQTFDSTDLYPTPQEKAAAIIESILINHPFIDGNKRTGYFLMRSILLLNKLDISAIEEEKYTFVIDIASGKLKFQEILSWINKRMVELR